MPKKRLPVFVKGVLETINCLHWKMREMPEKEVISIMCGHGTDVTTANGYMYAFLWNPTTQEYEAIKIKD